MSGLIMTGFWVYCLQCKDRHVFQINSLGQVYCPVCGWLWPPKKKEASSVPTAE